MSKASASGFSYSNPNSAYGCAVTFDDGTNINSVRVDSTSISHIDSLTAQQVMDAMNADIITAALANYSLTMTASDIYWLPAVASTPWTFNYPSLAVNTARQASSSKNAMVNASVDITATLSLTTGQKGTVALQYADDSGFTTNVKTAQGATNGNTGTLTLGLALGQTVTAAVSGVIPAGKYYRLLTTQNTGTPSFGTPVIQEVITN